MIKVTIAGIMALCLTLVFAVDAQQSAVVPVTQDFGDAPDSYQTTLSLDGARHQVLSEHLPRLGEKVDAEADGHPHADALGDDNHNQDDEDGVLLLGDHLIPGEDNMFEVRLSGPGFLHVWIDIDRNHEFQSSEYLITGLPVEAGDHMMNVPIPLPPDLEEGPLYGRFRITTLEEIPPFGDAPDGEVEDYLWIIESNEEELDFGDAPGMTDLPGSYPTLLADNGARHQISRSIFLGLHNPPDAEADGQPDPEAKGDDLNGYDDEDGVAFLSSLIPAGTATIKVKATVMTSAAAHLNAWIDFNADGNWDDSSEKIFSALPITSGSHTLSFTVPDTAIPGPTFARFRISSVAELPVTDFCQDGEVEDYKIRIGQQEENFDWGDAPDDPDVPTDYPTLSSSNGAVHQITPFLYLGNQGLPDAEADGQPHLPDASGDDSDGNDDEQAIHPLTPLIAGSTAQLSVTVHADGVSGVLNAWIDFNADGDWQDSNEQIVTDQILGSGAHTISFPVAAAAINGHTIGRFRLSSARGLEVTGMAPDGEVEDHPFFIGEQVIDHDFGDLPDPAFCTLLASNGARHVVPADPMLFLGNKIDTEADGQPSSDATGDDTDHSDDEDGVSFTTLPVAGHIATAKVVASAPGYLNAWMDFNNSGDFQSIEHCINGKPLNSGINFVSFQIPASAIPGLCYTRFRFSSQRQLSHRGAAPDGEVEDYQIEIQAGEPNELDFGDAPQSPDNANGYQTLLAADGARHVANNTYFLGTAPDTEPDGQPDPSALGDDQDGHDDEDGIIFPSALITGTAATFTVQTTAPSTQPGFLNAWLDINADGDWQDPGEHIIVDNPLGSGSHTITVNLPFLQPGITYARFRYSSVRGLKSFGPAPNGEVEDYQIEIAQGDEKWDFGDLPDQPYQTLLATDGARHQLILPLRLGDKVDAEIDGQPTATADGDDLNDSDDEDGVWLSAPWIPGSRVTIRVKVMGIGKLNAWVDFDQNGMFDLPGEQIVVDDSVYTGFHHYNITIPASAVTGRTGVRFRIDQNGGLGPNGPAQTGEVEDYLVIIEDQEQLFDFGDLPDRFFRTLLLSDGARHLLNPDIFMGALIDTESDGQPTTQADGDDNLDQDDEDGVTFTSTLVQGDSATVEIVVSQDGFINTWFDWNGNYHFDPLLEWVFKDKAVNQGSNILKFRVPKNTEPGRHYARFRYCSQRGLQWFGPAPDGEVEDYIAIVESADLEWDFGDLPDMPYPTLLASDGARHHIDEKVFLGRRIDADRDGQPDTTARGDDLDGGDDEDGVMLRLMPHTLQKSGFTVMASTDGYLNAWIDWNNNGSFAENSDQICSDHPLKPGKNHIVITVPTTVPQEPLYARFRFNTAGGLSWHGEAENGEVEDYFLRFNPVEPEEWSVPIRLLLHEQTAVQVFGVHPDAGDGFDTGLDVLAPPPPPDGISCYFECPADPQVHLQTDLRNPEFDADSNEIVWTLILEADGPSTLSWDPFTLPPRGLFTLQSNSGSVSVNMRRQSSVTLENTQTVLIRFSLHTSVGFDFSRQGWHMASLPVIPDNNQVADLFPNLMGDQAYEWNPLQGEYVPVSELLSGHGYWLPVQNPLSVEISGEPLDFLELGLQPGWNMIGAPFDIGSVQADPADAVSYQFIEWDNANNSYMVVQELLATHAYWVYATSECVLIIYSGASDSPQLQKQLAKTGACGSPPPPPFKFTGIESEQKDPARFKVEQNYPNPFNPATALSYTLEQDGHVHIAVYNVQGENVRILEQGWKSAGEHGVRWDGLDADGENVPSGLYLIRVKTDNHQKTIKAMRLK
jgi:hypothetical protein